MKPTIFLQCIESLCRVGSDIILKRDSEGNLEIDAVSYDKMEHVSLKFPITGLGEFEMGINREELVLLKYIIDSSDTEINFMSEIGKSLLIEIRNVGFKTEAMHEMALFKIEKNRFLLADYVDRFQAKISGDILLDSFLRLLKLYKFSEYVELIPHSGYLHALDQCSSVMIPATFSHKGISTLFDGARIYAHLQSLRPVRTTLTFNWGTVKDIVIHGPLNIKCDMGQNIKWSYIVAPKVFCEKEKKIKDMSIKYSDILIK